MDRHYYIYPTLNPTIENVRSITTREAARLQSSPDDIRNFWLIDEYISKAMFQYDNKSALMYIFTATKRAPNKKVNVKNAMIRVFMDKNRNNLYLRGIFKFRLFFRK